MNDDPEKQRILIVDDEPDNIRILAEALADDYELFGATNGNEAIECASGRERPDLILLDIIMPDMNGYEILKALKAGTNTRDIPVIFITVMGRELNELRGFEMGAVDYVMKPFSPAIVRERVRTHLELKYYRDYLEDIVHKRTDELVLSNRRLRKEILQRKEIKAHLEDLVHERTRENLESLLNSLDDFLFVLNREGYIAFATPVAEKRLGYSQEELRRKRMLDLYPPDTRTKVSDALARVSPGEKGACDVPLLAKDGTRIPVESLFKRGDWDKNEAIFAFIREISGQTRGPFSREKE